MVRPVVMERPATPEMTASAKHYPLHRAFWLVLQDIDANKSQRDLPDYRYRNRQTQRVSLQSLCDQHALQRYSNRGDLKDFTGETLMKSLSNVWSLRLRRNMQSISELWRKGSAGCSSHCVQEFKKSYEYLVRHSIALPNAKATTRDRSTDSGLILSSSIEQVNAEQIIYSSDHSDSEHAFPLRDRGRTIGNTEAGIRRSKRRNTTATCLISRAPSPADRKGSSRTPGGSLSARQSNIDVNKASFSPAPLTFVDVNEELASLHSLSQQSTLWLSGHLRLEKCLAVVSPRPNYFLLPLYKRCWGEDWKNGADLLAAAGNRSVEDDTLALISAFLLDKIFLRTGLCKIKTNRIGQPDPTQKAAAVADDDHDHDDEPSFDLSKAGLIVVQAESLSAQLLIAIGPYINGLVQISRLVHANRCEVEINSFEHSSFRRDLSRVVENALRLRIRLDDSKYKASFLWPERGEVFDPARMQVPYALSRSDPAVKYTVAFTKFPGIELEYLGRKAYETEVAFKAYVVLRMGVVKGVAVHTEM